MDTFIRGILGNVPGTVTEGIVNAPGHEHTRISGYTGEREQSELRTIDCRMRDEA